MSRFTSADVESRYGVGRRLIRELVRVGLVQPRRGPQRQYQFEFVDVVTLRMAQELSRSKVPVRKIARFLAAIQAEGKPTALSRRLRVAVIGRELAVLEESAARTENGQLLLNLGHPPLPGTVHPITLKTPEDAPDLSPGSDLINVTRLENDFRRTLEENPHDVDAYLELGVLLLETGRADEARALYQRSVRFCPAESRLHFNLGICYEELKALPEALAAYRAALFCEPTFAEAHYNVALVYEELGDPQKTLRHLNAYRKFASDSTTH